MGKKKLLRISCDNLIDTEEKAEGGERVERRLGSNSFSQIDHRGNQLERGDLRLTSRGQAGKGGAANSVVLLFYSPGQAGVQKGNIRKRRRGVGMKGKHTHQRGIRAILRQVGKGRGAGNVR